MTMDFILPFSDFRTSRISAMVARLGVLNRCFLTGGVPSSVVVFFGRIP